VLEKLLGTMDILLGDKGCPWDKEQTHESLCENLKEECNEVIEAIFKKDFENLKEELGDVLLQVVFHAKIAEKAGRFNMQDIILALDEKLISRHSHIFGSDVATSAEEAMDFWNKNKKKERKTEQI